jgi:hypothetical protein
MVQAKAIYKQLSVYGNKYQFVVEKHFFYHGKVKSVARTIKEQTYTMFGTLGLYSTPL